MDAPRAVGAEGRSAGLDLFKAVLVAGMVATHVVQLLAFHPPAWAETFATVVNLMAFSGFLLAFGVGVGLSRDRPRPWGERLRAPLLLLLAVWASSVGFLWGVERAEWTGALVLDVLTMRRLFGWSEFLTTFLVLALVIAVGRGALLRLADRPRLLLALAGAGLASTLVVTERMWPLLGGVIGHWGYANFPLLAYAPWVLAGLALGRARRGVEGADLWLGAAASLPVVLWLAQTGEMPRRFPPTAAWVLGPGILLVGLLWLCERAPRLPAWATAPGRHVLLALVASNLAIFALRRGFGLPLRDPVTLLAAMLGMLALVWTLCALRAGVGRGAGVSRAAGSPAGEAR